MRERQVESVEAVVERQQHVPPECHNHRLFKLGQGGGMKRLRPGLQILNGCPLLPLCDRFRVDPQLPAQRHERSLRPLYCCSDGVRGRGTRMTNLSHMAYFHSNERIAPSNRKIKHLGTYRNTALTTLDSFHIDTRRSYASAPRRMA